MQAEAHPSQAMPAASNAVLRARELEREELRASLLV